MAILVSEARVSAAAWVCGVGPRRGAVAAAADPGESLRFVRLVPAGVDRAHPVVDDQDSARRMGVSETGSRPRRRARRDPRAVW